MAIIIIPFDYDERTHPSVVPIAVSDEDRAGNQIDHRLIVQGVVPVADPLRQLSHRILGDVHRVSEITEHAVQSLWRTHGPDFGDQPSVKVLSRAKSYAEDARYGGRRARRKMDVELFDSTLENLRNEHDHVRAFHAKDTVDRLWAELDRLGLHDVRDMLLMMLRECDAQEFVARFGACRNTLSQRFYRGVRRAAQSAGITWHS